MIWTLQYVRELGRNCCATCPARGICDYLRLRIRPWERCVVERNGLEWFDLFGSKHIATSRVYRGVSRGWHACHTWSPYHDKDELTWTQPVDPWAPPYSSSSSSSPPPLSAKLPPGCAALQGSTTTTYFPLPNYLLSTEGNSHFSFYHGDENYFHPKDSRRRMYSQMAHAVGICSLVHWLRNEMHSGISICTSIYFLLSNLGCF